MQKSNGNERRKLSAQYLNGLAIAVLVAGVIGPTLTRVDDGYAIAACAVISVALHIAARQAVGGIKDL